MGFFFHLPNQQDLRTNTSYHKIFALQLLWNVGLLGMLIMLLFIIFFILKTYQIQKQSKYTQNRIRQSLLSQQSRQQSKRLSERQNEESTGQIQQSNGQSLSNVQMRYPQTKIFKICNFFTSFFFYFLWVDISFIYLVFYMFGFMGRGISHDILSVFIMTLIVLIPTLIWKNTTKISQLKVIKNQIIFTGICLLLWMVLSTFLIITLKGACLCYYNDNYGLSVNNEQGPFLSTQYTRSNNIDKICPDKQICNIYATVPEQPESQVFINLHTGTGLDNITVILMKDNKQINAYQYQSYNMTNVEDIGKRLVYTFLFKNLTANTLYKVKVYQNPRNITSSQQQSSSQNKSLKQQQDKPIYQTNYKTTPAKDTQVLKLAVGGDVSMTAEGNQLTLRLKDYNPDIIFIGGDVTYDDGMRTCYYSWDNFYSIFSHLNKQLNRLVPLVMSVGNHDVGFDSLANVQLDKDIQQIPLFYLYNPQHLSLDKKGNIPQLSDRSTVHYHVIGPTVHLHLDSGYILDYKSQQNIIQFIGKKYQEHYLFANYHNPIYPSCTNPDRDSNDFEVISNGLKYWTPYFDQYKFIAGFEHHTHHKKFTNKISNNTVQQQSGTRYIGDGSWGVLQGNCPNNKVNPKKQFFKYQDVTEPNHIWLVTLDYQSKFYSVNYTAINIKGKVDFTHTENLRLIA